MQGWTKYKLPTEAMQAVSQFAGKLETPQDLNSVTIPEGAVEKSISHQTWLKKLHHLAFSSTQGHTAELPPEREEDKVLALNNFGDGLGGQVWNWHRRVREKLNSARFDELTAVQVWAWKEWLHGMANAVISVRTELARQKKDAETQACTAVTFLVKFPFFCHIQGCHVLAHNVFPDRTQIYHTWGTSFHLESSS